MTKAQINKALKKIGLPMQIQNKRGGGYSYFTSTNTGSQIGESVMVCYLNQCSVEKWVEYAQAAYEEQKEDNSELI